VTKQAIYLLAGGLVAITISNPLVAATVDLEDLPLAPNSYHNGDPGTNNVGTYDGSFMSRGAGFNNTFLVEDFGSPGDPVIVKFWGGWAYSNTTDVTTPGVDASGHVVNESSAYNLPGGGGAAGSANYGVAYYDPFGFTPVPVITLPTGAQARSMLVTNTTYAALSMLHGDQFSSPFHMGDSFVLHVTGADANGASVGVPVDFFLADYRELNGQPDSLVSQWTSVDLSSLAGAKKLSLSIQSTNSGTPTYFALDNLQLAPVLGDLNLDGSITVADASALMGALADLPAYETAHHLTNAALASIGDLNGDGAVTNADIQALINKLPSAPGSGGLAVGVPEPAGGGLAICSFACWIIFARRYRYRMDVPRNSSA